jgi:hypothetical protein
MKKFLLAVLVFGAGYATTVYLDNAPGRGATIPAASAPAAAASNRPIADAFEHRASDVQVHGTGVVRKILRDDDEGSRHQRFIVQLDAGHTVLIAHNIDLAPRVAALREGDTVTFYGEYEWNPKGGVIHWTHRDPAGRHVDGWIEHDGRRYQ